MMASQHVIRRFLLENRAHLTRGCEQGKTKLFGKGETAAAVMVVVVVVSSFPDSFERARHVDTPAICFII